MNIHHVISDITFLFDPEIKNVRATQCNMWLALSSTDRDDSQDLLGTRCKPCSDLSSLPVLKNIAERAPHDCAGIVSLHITRKPKNRST
mmetsp:Transcript_12079/g.18139  ORF Transcript_12079/g.18139 Transcript_12079/m.18139 type:complete len:89 (+) Transcript_12079:254-520(+)